MLKYSEIAPYLTNEIDYLGTATEGSTSSFSFLHKKKSIYIDVCCKLRSSTQIFIDYKLGPLFDFDHMEESSRLCLMIKTALEQSKPRRMHFITGLLHCSLSSRIITDLPNYEGRCSYDEFMESKQEILDFFHFVSLYKPEELQSHPNLSNLYVYGRDGFMLGHFLEELSIARSYPEKEDCFFAFEFYPPLLCPSVYRSERLEVILNFLIQKGYKVFIE